MELHINRQSEITAHQQLREQIIFLISTGQLAIGQEMPSVRSLVRRLRISVNTVSKVYSELVRGGWLVNRPGAHHLVVSSKATTEPKPGSDLDSLIDYIVNLAHVRGYSLQKLAAHLRRRLLQEPPDHLLIVEPDSGMGQMMREEIHTKIGYAPPTCGLSLLQQNPALAIGAILIAPSYVVPKLAQYIADRSRILSVSYSPIDRLMLAISRLSEPSMIGWVSVSAAGLKTISGMAAQAIGNRHSNHLFLLERLDSKHTDQFRLRRYRPGEYQPKDILKPTTKQSQSAPAGAEPANAYDDTQAVSAADIGCMHLLFMDSISCHLIHHPQSIHYQLLSDESLDRIKAVARKLPKSGEIPARTT